MKKYQKISLGVLSGAVSFVALYYGVLFVLPDVVDLNKYKNDYAAAIEAQSGFKFSCENIELKRSLTPYLKINMYHTLILYPNDEVFLKLKESELKVKLLPLLFKKIVIKDAKLTRPIINITLYEDFSTSLERYFDANKNISTNGFVINSVIKDTLCERYKLKVDDKSTGKLFHLEGDELLLKDVRLNDKAHFVLKGALFEGENEHLKYNLDIVAPLNSKSQFTFSPFKTIYDSDIKGEIEGKLAIDKNNTINGYLNVDKVSLKIDDVVLEENSIDLIFSGQEAEINSVLHTSKTDSATLTGKLAYGKKKAVELKAKAKNVNLSNLFKIVCAITQTLNIPNKLKDIKISGLVDADFSINSDFQKLKSNGSAKIINAKIVHNSLPYEVSKINSNVNFNNNKIVIEQAQALVNSTPVNLSGVINEDVSLQLKASFEKLNLKNIVSLFKIELPANVQQGKISLTSDITGVLNKSLSAKADVNISDLAFLDKTYNLPVSVKSVDMKLDTDGKKYVGEVVCADLKSSINKKPLSAESFKAFFDEKKITVPENTVKLLSSPLNIQGSISQQNVNLNFDGDILASDLALLLKENINQPYKAVGKIKTAGDFSMHDKTSNVKLQLRADENNYLSYAVIKELFKKQSFLEVNCALNADKIQLKDVSLYENSDKPNKILALNGGIKLAKTLGFDNLKINVPSPITVTTNFFGGEEISFDADLLLNNNISAPKINGNAKIFVLNIKKYLTAIKNADVSFADDNIRVIAPDVQINNSKLNLLADVNPAIKDKLSVSNLQLHCANLDMNSLFELIEKEANPFAKSLIAVKKGIATINNFSVLDLKARDISADFSLDENIIKVKNISANAYDGEVTGSLNYDIAHSLLDIMLDGKNINMKNSLYDLCKLDDNISGIADFSSNISLVTGQYNNVINSLSGKLDFTSTNGKMGTLGKFEYYLYAQNILYHGLLKTTLNRIADIFTKDTTAQYRNAQGSLLFQNGYMITESIKTIGKDMSLYVKGRHNLISNQVNIDIYGKISDEITSKLGSFGNVSISDFMENKSTKSVNNIILLPQNVIDEIPDLYNQGSAKTNIFKVNILGDINSLNAINSFMWILPKQEIPQPNEQLPDFTDMLQTL